jgi:hypothetical protein
MSAPLVHRRAYVRPYDKGCPSFSRALNLELIDLLVLAMNTYRTVRNPPNAATSKWVTRPNVLLKGLSSATPDDRVSYSNVLIRGLSFNTMFSEDIMGPNGGNVALLYNYLLFAPNEHPNVHTEDHQQPPASTRYCQRVPVPLTLADPSPIRPQPYKLPSYCRSPIPRPPAGSSFLYLMPPRAHFLCTKPLWGGRSFVDYFFSSNNLTFKSKPVSDLTALPVHCRGPTSRAPSGSSFAFRSHPRPSQM